MIIIALSLVSQVSASDVAANDEVISDEIDLDDEVLSVEDSPVVSTNYAPKDAGDLQKCIDDANDGDTIVLNGTYELKSTVIVNKAVNIIGSDDGATVKKDDFSSSKIRYFNINSSNVVLSNLRFVDGQNQYGGAIYWSGDNGSIINCKFENNMVVNDGSAGAVMAVGNNILIEDSLFSNNRATKGNGGAITITGDGAVIRNCHFDDNKVDNGSAGAILLLANDCAVENCNFTNNYCTDFGGAIVTSNRSNRISNSYFKNNNVKNNVSSKGGGAIYSDCEDLTVDKCNFTSNHAFNAFGGAISVDKHNVIKNSEFRDNHALLGNAIYGASYSNVMNNYFAIAFNDTEIDTVHVAELTQSNNTYEVIKEDSNVIFISGMVFDYATSGSIYVTVEGGTIALENISIINHTEARISFKDNVLVVSNLAVGEYILRVVTTPDEAHNSVESFLPVTVKKSSAVIKATKTTVALKSGASWSITLVDAKTKKPISNMELTLKVYTGKKYQIKHVKTNKKGIATFQTKILSKGNHKIVVSGSHEGYNFNTLTSSINVIKPTALSYKVKSSTRADGSRLSITVYKKATKKPIVGVKIKLLIYTGKKFKTVVLKTTTHSGFKGVCAYGTNDLSVGNHKVVLKPVDIKYIGSAKSKMVIKKSSKKYPSWTKKISGKV